MIEAARIARQSSVYNFLTSGNAFIREGIVGGQIRQFLRPNVEHRVEMLCKTESGEYNIITQIYDTFSRFDAVMTVERLTESLPLFLKRLGLKGFTNFPHVNSSPPRGDIDVDRVRELLLEISYIDFVIYDLAQSFENRFLRQMDLELGVADGLLVD